MAFVDVETTGGSSERHRVIEVAIIRIEPDGSKRVYSKLINPQRPVSSFVLELTGIRPDELVDAPIFEDVAWDAWSLLNGAVFVAHNARFDFAFLRREYERLDSEFKSRTLCSVLLSRKLYPEYRKHDLSSVVQRSGLAIERRHRALDDAQAVVDFFEHASGEKPARFRKVFKELLKRPSDEKSRLKFRQMSTAASSAEGELPVIQLLPKPV